MDAQACVAWNLRRLRVARGLSQEKLAVDAGIDRTYVGRLERLQENPTVAVLMRVAAALDVPVVALFEEPAADAEPPKPLPGGRRKR